MRELLLRKLTRGNIYRLQTPIMPCNLGGTTILDSRDHTHEKLQLLLIRYFVCNHVQTLQIITPVTRSLRRDLRGGIAASGKRHSTSCLNYLSDNSGKTILIISNVIHRV